MSNLKKNIKYPSANFDASNLSNLINSSSYILTNTIVEDLAQNYNNDPFTGSLSTPVNSSSFTRALLENLPAYRSGISPRIKGLEVGMAHGYFLLGPFYLLGPLRNAEISLVSGFLSTISLILILTLCLSIYGNTSFDKNEPKDYLFTTVGWSKFTGGFSIGAIGGAGFAYLLLANVPVLQSFSLSIF
uniref:Photosystem I reaction center subunit XI n=1 Tax=Dicranema revolutum TaxID=239144 RepID=A0A4D6WUW7_9FLOR|nr:photosystem I reaction center subunit XI [Dicranema revolutum]